MGMCEFFGDLFEQRWWFRFPSFSRPLRLWLHGFVRCPSEPLGSIGLLSDSRWVLFFGAEGSRSLALTDDYSEEQEKLAFVCACAIDSVKTGGSVLVPINRIGIVLQLLELMSTSLDSSNLKVPIYFISSVAEELLAFTNVIPEWLCKERQEKLFSGKPLFAHSTLIKEKKLHVFSAVHSPELLASWQEPCIVFSPSWSLRLGPAVHLLRRWSGDPNSLLVLENGIDAEVALLPYKPMAMKVLRCSFLSGIKLNKVQPLLEILQPKEVVEFQLLLRKETTNDLIVLKKEFKNDLKELKLDLTTLHTQFSEDVKELKLGFQASMNEKRVQMKQISDDLKEMKSVMNKMESDIHVVREIFGALD